MAYISMGLLITRWGFPSRRLSRVSQGAFQFVSTDMETVHSNGQAVLDRCMSLLESNEANNEEAEIDPMLGQSHPSTGKQ